MKRLIRFILNAIPRPVLQRMAGWAVPLLGLLYVGRGRECPVCGTKRRKFLPYGYVISRDNALCPNCLSLERHRLLWLWLQRESDLFEQRPRLLHVAPEVCLMRHLRRTYAGGEARRTMLRPIWRARWRTYTLIFNRFRSKMRASMWFSATILWSTLRTICGRCASSIA